MSTCALEPQKPETKTRPLVRREQANRAAAVLKDCPDVKEVWLFGSLARGDVGKDIDLILVTNELTAQFFISDAREEMQAIENAAKQFPGLAKRFREGIYGHAHVRFMATMNAIEGYEQYLFDAGLAAGDADFDFFVFPPNWHERLDELQKALPHSDPLFMQNIARDAIKL